MCDPVKIARKASNEEDRGNHFGFILQFTGRQP
jgi:hypothetical protein